MNKKLIIAASILVAGIAWYAFRPERLFINQTVNESLPAASSATAATSTSGPQLLVSGRFHDGAHKTAGVASIYQLPEGKRVLRLTNFETSNGPDVQVYLVAAADVMDSETVKQAGFVRLGSLKGNMGDQNYDVPADVDLAKYRSATIWCARFGVNFGTAPLQAEAAGGSAMGSSSSPATLASGKFHGVAHETEGTATIYQLADGRRVLRLTEFKTSNGPDVQVYLVAANDANDSDTVKKAGFLPLGALKGNEGDQNYDLPSNADLGKYRAVTIWCRRFGVNFATASLGAQN
jgi:Electron transfer DM13